MSVAPAITQQGLSEIRITSPTVTLLAGIAKKNSSSVLNTKSVQFIKLTVSASYSLYPLLVLTAISPFVDSLHRPVCTLLNNFLLSLLLSIYIPFSCNIIV